LNKIYTVPFKCDFIDVLTKYILKLNKGRDLSQFAIVFPGKRPSLFLIKSLKEKIDAPFIPPFRYSIDEFMEFLFGLKRIEKIPGSEIDLIYLLYRAIKENVSDIRNSKVIDLIREFQSFKDFNFFCINCFLISKSLKTEFSLSIRRS